MIFTGIGSRETPTDILTLMQDIAKRLCSEGAILRSGGADGADTAFEAGCNSVSGKCEIYLPWLGFNNRRGARYIPNPTTEARAMACQLLGMDHWNRLSEGGRKLHARNMHQVLGLNLKTPSDVVVCYTSNGETKGGTGTALKLAMKHNIPVRNLGNSQVYLNVVKWISNDECGFI